MQRCKAVMLLSLLFACEGAGIVALLAGSPGQQSLGFALGHGAASLLAASLRGLLPGPYRPGVTGALLPAALVLLLPLFGLLGLTVVILPALHRPVRRQARTWRQVAIPRLPPTTAERVAGRSPVAGGKSLIDIIQSDAPMQQRIAAVMAVRRLPTRAAVPILRVALRDPADDVRLLAYAMLDRRDAALQGRIQQHEAELARGRLPAADQAALHRTLARLHWELSYCGLATGAVAARALDSARAHARAAIDAEPDRGTLFLLGRILLRQGELRAAEHVLLEARDQGIADSSIRPFLAEIAFLERRFQHVRDHLQAGGHDGAQRPGVVSDVGRFWLPEAA